MTSQKVKQRENAEQATCQIHPFSAIKDEVQGRPTPGGSLHSRMYTNNLSPFI